MIPLGVLGAAAGLPSAASGWAAAVSSHGPALWYRMEETSGLTLMDSGPNGIHATLSGADASNASAKVYGETSGYAGMQKRVRLNGNSYDIYGQASHHNALNITGDITFAVLVNVRASVSANFPKLLWKVTNASSGRGTFHLFVDKFSYGGNGRFKARISIGGTNYDVVDPDTINTETEYWILARRAGNVLSIWRNGAKKSERSDLSGAAETGTGVLYVGGGPIRTHDPITASLDEVVVWPTALTDAQIAALWASRGT